MPADEEPAEGSRRLPGGPNPFLAVVGGVLICAALVGYFREQSAATVDLFAFLGVAVCTLAVFEPRMRGTFSMGPHQVAFELVERPEQVAEAIEAAEDQVAAHHPLPELPPPAPPLILLSQRARRRLDEAPAAVRSRLLQELRRTLEAGDVSQGETISVAAHPGYRAVALDDDFRALFRPLSEDEVKEAGAPNSRPGYVVADLLPRKRLHVQA